MGKLYTEDQDLDIIDQVLVVNPFRKGVRWEDLHTAVMAAIPALSTRTCKSIRDRVQLLLDKRKREVAKEEAGSGIAVPPRTPLQIALDEALHVKDEEDRKTEEYKRQKGSGLTQSQQGQIIVDAALGVGRSHPSGATAPPCTSGSSDNATSAYAASSSSDNEGDLAGNSSFRESPIRTKRSAKFDVGEYLAKKMKKEEERELREKARQDKDIEIRLLELEHSRKEAEEERKLRRDELEVRKIEIENRNKRDEDYAKERMEFMRLLAQMMQK